MNDHVVRHKIAARSEGLKVRNRLRNNPRAVCGFISIDFLREYGRATYWNDNVTCPKCMHIVNLADHTYKGRVLPYANR